MAGFVKTCNRLLPNIPNIDSMAQFWMILSGIKPSDTYPYEKSIQAKADRVVNTMYLYLAKNFEDIFEIKELEIIFKCVVENSPEEMYIPCRANYQSKKEAFVSMIDKWMARFNESQDKNARTDC